MILNYNGHSCFTVRDGERTLVFDPFQKIGYQLQPTTCDYCLCTHKHFDHFAVENINCKAVICPDNYLKFPFVRAIKTYHDDACGEKRGENLVFIYKSEGITLCHFGDLGEPFSQSLCDKIGKVDVLLIPVGGNYTINALNAAKYAKQLNAPIVIPMHYKTKRSNIDIESKEEFLSYFGNVIKVENPVTIKQKNLPQQQTVFDFNDDLF